jgi:hypothetical protein
MAHQSSRLDWSHGLFAHLTKIAYSMHESAADYLSHSCLIENKNELKKPGMSTEGLS